MGTGGNFDEELKLFQDPLTKDMHVDAIGPSYGDVVHICVWIVQKQDGGDAVAAQITTMTGRPGFEMGTRPSETPGEPPEKYWKLRALQASEVRLDERTGDRDGDRALLGGQ